MRCTGEVSGEALLGVMLSHCVTNDYLLTQSARSTFPILSPC